ncbi:TetR/AcrR family transcriptional regulator [Streptomyces sp. NPDC059009]|uniref:TetR/AcrR family transcriptional regulator n=1 Tax=Streptomyces sp. NPDC059009 TaxID=3346694 RepID=UPI0036C82671
MAEARGAKAAEEPRAEGLRERKKRRTRQHISDVATGLFLERGFDAVTIAEIAAAADVSVNTVYNYFPAKEDLFLDRMDGVQGRLSRTVRGREPGESAAAAVVRELRHDIQAVSPRVGLVDGYDRFMHVINGAPTLKARLFLLQQQVLDSIVATLREETEADEGDPLPLLIGGQLAWVESALVRYIGAEMMKGRKATKVSRDALALLDEMEDLLSEKVLNYAVRAAR